tara:strand:+ start:154 stop:441 length:288 start_codon:yes stop_codon:yes gene_type:complete
MEMFLLFHQIFYQVLDLLDYMVVVEVDVVLRDQEKVVEDYLDQVVVELDFHGNPLLKIILMQDIQVQELLELEMITKVVEEVDHHRVMVMMEEKV